MSRLIRNVKKRFARKERGQVLVLVTLAAVGIIAIVGLTLDVGILFIQNGRLRRAVDAAALSAALQIREGYTIEKLTESATEFLALNGIQLDAGHPITVETCDTTPDLCDPNVPRKLVRVTATATVHLAFLPVIGIDTVNMQATATSEAASVDVVLVLDRSESMTNDVDPEIAMRDPSYCNIHPELGRSGNQNIGGCLPFNDVQDAAAGFVQQLFFPYDRVAIVTFDKDPHLVLALGDDCPHPATPCTMAEEESSHTIQTNIINKIRSLTVYEGDETNGHTGVYPDGIPSRCYWYYPDQPADNPGFHDDPDKICEDTVFNDDTGSNYAGLQIPGPDDVPLGIVAGDPSQGTTTNIGGGLMVAGDELAQPPVRQEALWVVILLTDGVANAGYSDADDDGTIEPDEYYCPSTTWPGAPGNHPWCNDGANSVDGMTGRHALGDPLYDADDYAYDMADFVGKPYPAGQGALIFSIGLGDAVKDLWGNPTVGLGESLLKYAASDAVGKGEYFFAPGGEQLREIFRKIGDNIATRLTH